MKQTAVNWMANELLYLDNEYDMKFIDKNEYQARRKEIVNQAKQMEKNQIVNAVHYTCSAMSHSDKPCGEEYYDITFKSE
jgi:hypothetical protein